ncbi:zinc ribbon domain-containing protein [Pseudobutyrivibrio sp. MD2005]|uniref:zinc ribbon domain-containing protein n=1 Tax=Pseudobutyrivibrio sp. MD2005 TaxID=1410616 RepID=UPI000486129D|nr:zinc ribbon domain-containing protein [Pseudobutyrivibrio sp. MD2005]
MFCTKCGNELTDNSKFCPKCGTPVGAAEDVATNVETQTTVEEPVVTEAPAEEAAPVVEEAPVSEAAPTAEAASEEPVASTVVTDNYSEDYNYGFNPADIPEPTKKSGSKKGIFIGVGVVAVVVAAALAVGYFVFGLFASPAQILTKTIDNGKNDIFDEYKTGYKSIQDSYKDLNGDMTLSVEAELGDKAKSLLDEAGSSVGADLSWIESGRADVAVDVQEEQIGFDIKGSLNGQEIGTVNAILDANSEKAYVSVPEVLGNTAIEAEGDFDSEEFMEMLASYTETFTKYAEMYPDPDKFNKCATKYTDIISKDLSKCEIEKSKEEVTAGDVTAKYTALEIELDKKTSLQIADDLINELEDDEELKELLRPLFEAELSSPEFEGYFDDYDDYWDYMIDELSSAKDDIEDQLDEIEDDEDLNEDVATLYVYVDGFDFKGIALEPEDADGRIEFYTVEKGDKSGVRFCFDDGTGTEYVFEGQGETKKGKLSGTYTFEQDDEEYFTIEVKDFDKDAFEKSRDYNGHFIFSLGEGLTGDFYDETSEMFGLAKYDLSLETKGATGTMGLDILVDDESLAKITMTYSMEDVKDMKIPSDTVDVENMDEEELLNFVKGIKLDTLVDNLEKAGVPEEYYQTLSEVSDALASGDDYEIYNALSTLMYGTSYDSYGYDDYYDDYDDYDYDYPDFSSMTYDEFADYYRENYDPEASDEDIEYYYDLFQY